MSVLSIADGMARAGKHKSNVKSRQFWRHHNKLMELWSGKVIEQKIDYIRNNQIEAGLDADAIDGKFNSARNYAEDDITMKIDNEGIILGVL